MGTPPDEPAVTVRYWAAARAAAGVGSDTVGAGNLGQVLEAVRALHQDSARFADVVSVCSVLVDEQPVGTRAAADVSVAAGSTVDLLPPFAGG